MNPGKLTYESQSSSARTFKLLKGLSNTRAAIDGSLSAYIKEVTAPIDLPHNAIVLTSPDYRK